MERARSSNLTPALIASAVLHVGGFAAGYLTWPQTSPPILDRPDSVPVTIVTSAPVADVRPAAEAEVQEVAATPEPVPEATPAPPAPAKIAPAPAPAPPPPKPAPAPKPALDLDALAKNLPKTRPQPPRRPALDLEALAENAPRAPARPRSGPPTSSAERGPLRAETDVRARPAVGLAQGLSGDWTGALAAKLNRLWNPNCGVEGAANVVIRVRMRLTSDGRVIEAVDLDQGRNSSHPVVAAASARALSAVARGQPYGELPRDEYDAWREITFNFNAREACR